MRLIQIAFLVVLILLVVRMVKQSGARQAPPDLDLEGHGMEELTALRHEIARLGERIATLERIAIPEPDDAGRSRPLPGKRPDEPQPD